MKAALVVLLVCVFPIGASAQPPRGGLNGIDGSGWALEHVACRDGRTFSGLIRHENDRQIELVEVGRQPGRPMNLLVRPIKSAEIIKIDRLSKADRELLRQRIDAFRNRVGILAALIDDVRLSQQRKNGNVTWHYTGPWFTLESWADEQLTREAIVRIEQTFAAYRTILTPRRDAPRPLRIELVGSVHQFRDLLAAAGLNINSSAFFDPRQNLIVAGGDLATFTKRLKEARAHHADLKKQVSEDSTRADQLAQELNKALESQGADPEKRRQVVNAARAQFQKQRQTLLRQISQAEQKNSEMYYRQFTRLYHEAFHAYLDNYVFDPQDYEVPRWLNEGWAQIFEAGLLDVNTLRIDAPRADLLSGLAADLRGESPLRLADVLMTPTTDYVSDHQAATANVARLYRASWGLAWYLTFERQLLGTPEMEGYLRRDGGEKRPIERFEKLVGQKLPAFEAQWRERMLELTPR
ncbi:MAG: hypothetical protein K8T91_27680 [Planctomycetes bacterium]|nr:hypothetical protein [Planctomycetota bacterium]